jgi:hypothetical protein
MTTSTGERAYAYFRVVAEELPLEDITAMVGRTPTRSWRKGEPGERNPSRPDSGWCLHGPLPISNLRIDEHVEALLPILEERSSAIRQLGQRFDTYLVCVGNYSKSSPGFFLSSAIVERIGALGLSLDCDLYCDCGASS